MLGQQVVKQARLVGLDVVSVCTGGDHEFRYLGGPIDELQSALGLGSEDTLVNCIGWIPQKSTGNAVEDARNAYLLNAELVSEISRLQRDVGFLWIQILTDCVFSGRQGNYDEASEKDASDLYGRSKTEGERFLEGAVGIRSSIVGPDVNTHAGLYSWFKSRLASEGTLPGYVNAHWNGVSTLAFSKLCVGMHLNRDVSPGLHHWVPIGSVTKFELLGEFATNLGRSKSVIVPATLAEPIDRRLSTLSTESNLKLWHLAGYPAPPTIKQICAEFISEDITQR